MNETSAFAITPRQPGDGLLLLVGTPIGDVRYLHTAAREALMEVDIIAAEDTRKWADLRRRADLHPPAKLVSFFEGNEAQRTGELVPLMVDGARVALVTDAGMPSVSDPGYRLVRGAIEAGVRVSAIPGPSAVLTALAVSGLATDRFCFEGFLPRKAGGRRTHLDELSTERRTLVFFESPKRLAQSLVAMAEAFGPKRQGAICRELTKTYEEVIRGSLAELIEWAGEGQVRGEITLVIAGASPPVTSLEEAVALARAEISLGEKPSVAVAHVAAHTGVDRKTLYKAAVVGASAV